MKSLGPVQKGPVIPAKAGIHPKRSHIRGAPHIGLTQEQVIEVFIHTTLYDGIPFTRAAMDIANEVFQSG